MHWYTSSPTAIYTFSKGKNAPYESAITTLHPLEYVYTKGKVCTKQNGTDQLQLHNQNNQNGTDDIMCT